MRRYTLTCPYARYRDGKIWCKTQNMICGNQKFCRMDGIMKLTDSAANCPIRRKEGETDGKEKRSEMAGA